VLRWMIGVRTNVRARPVRGWLGPFLCVWLDTIGSDHGTADAKSPTVLQEAVDGGPAPLCRFVKCFEHGYDDREHPSTDHAGDTAWWEHPFFSVRTACSRKAIVRDNVMILHGGTSYGYAVVSPSSRNAAPSDGP
jgi:hypothetical protein